MQDCSRERISDVERKTMDSYLKILSHSYPLLVPATFLVNVSLLCAAHFPFYRTGEACTQEGDEDGEGKSQESEPEGTAAVQFVNATEETNGGVFPRLEEHEVHGQAGLSPGSWLWKRLDEVKSEGHEEECSLKSEKTSVCDPIPPPYLLCISDKSPKLYSTQSPHLQNKIIIFASWEYY